MPNPHAQNNLDQTSQMIYEHCHSVQGPLNTIEGIASYIIEKNVSEEISSELKRIKLIANHLRSRTSALALVANIENKSLSRIPLEQIECGYIYRCTINILQQHSELVGESHKIQYQVNGEGHTFFGLHCLADHRLVRHVIEEVIQNAFQFSERSGTVRVNFSITDEHMRIEVENKGITMTQKDVEHVTERGWRSEGAQLSLANGKGLGLWTATAVSNTIGAKLRINPTNNFGITAVAICLPITR